MNRLYIHPEKSSFNIIQWYSIHKSIISAITVKTNIGII